MKTAVLFPGQGSQKVGMGSDLFDQFPEYEKKADEILGYSIRELCLEDAAGKLNVTSHTQPALFVVSALAYLDWKQKGGVASFAAGHSVGEYAALFAAGSIDFETGLRWVQKRGELMATVSGGGMAAVVGMSVDKIKEVLDQVKADTIDVANYNAPEQTVISGPAEDIARWESAFKEAGAKMYAILAVSGAFHSRYMKSSSDQFADFISTSTVKVPEFPVISNVEALPYTSGDSIKELLVKQIYSSVRWTESVLYLRSQGVEDYIELGSGVVLTRLLKKI
jgi:trans-AT polyketide synthase/acyltransferase/oxidoreductase domain-containing protein